MPRTSGIYSAPSGTEAVTGTTIESAPYNALVDDLVEDANAARPVSAGGTGATTASGALTNLIGTPTSNAIIKGNGTAWVIETSPTATEAEVKAATVSNKYIAPVNAPYILQRAGFVDIKAEGVTGDGSDETTAIQAAIDNAADDKVPYVTVPLDYVLGVSSTLKLGNGSTSAEATRNSVQLVGRGIARERALSSGFATKVSRIKWLGASGGLVVDVAGPVVGVGIKNFRIDGNNTAGKCLRVLSLHGGEFEHVMLNGATDVLLDMNNQQIPDASVASSEGYAIHNNATTTFKHITFDGYEGITSSSAICLLLDGWNNSGLGLGYDSTKLSFQDLYFSVNLNHNSSASDTCSDFTSGRAGIGIDLRACDSISFANVWMQGLLPALGTNSGTATSVMLRGRTGSGYGTTGYPCNITFDGKLQLGQYLKPRVDEASGYPGGNIIFPLQEVDAELLGGTRFMRYVQGFKPESVTSENVQHYISEYGYIRIRDESRNAVLNSSFSRATRGTSFTNPTNGQKLLDGGFRLEYDGSQSTVVSRQSFTLGQTDVAGEPKYHLRIATSSASGASSNGLAFDIPNVIRHAGRKCNFSAWLKVASSTSSVTCSAAQVFGTGGSPSTSVSVSSTEGSQTVTTAWKKFRWSFTMPSISGKTLGTNDDSSTKLLLGLPLNTAFTLDIACPQFELGEADSPWYRRTETEEDMECARYLQPFPSAGGGYVSNTAVVKDANTVRLVIHHKTAMRAAPTVWTASGASLGVQKYDATGGVKTVSSISINTGDQHVTVLDLTSTGHGLTVGGVCEVIASAANSFALTAEV